MEPITSTAPSRVSSQQSPLAKNIENLDEINHLFIKYDEENNLCKSQLNFNNSDEEPLDLNPSHLPPRSGAPLQDISNRHSISPSLAQPNNGSVSQGQEQE